MAGTYGSGITIVEPIGCWVMSWGPDLIAAVPDLAAAGVL